MRNSITSGMAVLALSALLSGGDCSAADLSPLPVEQPQPTASDWRFSIAPYFWAAGLSGDVGLFGRQPVDVDAGFDDIFDNLKFGGMVVGEAHNGTWGVLADLIYVKVGADEAITRSLRGRPVTLSASVDTDSLTATVMGEYRLPLAENVTVDLMAGGRLWKVDTDIDARLSAGGPRVAEFSGSDGSTWIDPMLGVKLRFDTGTPFYVTATGLIGGFGAAADIDWDILAGVGYEWSDRISGLVGYRALGVDYNKDGFVYDVVQQGVFLGAVVRF